jgi:hypothetical protein
MIVATIPIISVTSVYFFLTSTYENHSFVAKCFINVLRLQERNATLQPSNHWRMRNISVVVVYAKAI